MTNVNLSIPFEVLIKTIKSLDLPKQQLLLEILEEQIFEAEEEWENSPEIIAEVEEAKQAYQAGDYLTLEEFISSQSQTS
ncbi:MAG: hypothetical protein AB4063_20240 [Crocosphaera sp.]